MSFTEFAEKEDIKNFVHCLMAQSNREYSEEVFDTTISALHSIYKRANAMDKDEASMFVTTCLGLYMIESFENGSDLATDIKPRS